VLKACESGQAHPVFFDIGANLGLWTNMLINGAQQVGLADFRVYAFEPVPETRAQLENNLRGLEGDVRIIPMALSNSQGVADIAIASRTGGTNSLEFDRNAPQELPLVSIDKTTLSQFCKTEGVDHISLVKCDTEGHDSLVLEGALDLVNSGRIDVFQFEYNHRWIYSRSFLKDVFDIVHGLPYRVGALSPGGIDLFEEWHPELDRFFERNYVVVRDAALSWFDVHQGRFDASNVYR
jgi:FkbM family methyltransferase